MWTLIKSFFGFRGEKQNITFSKREGFLITRRINEKRK